jgi:hypothetical protein
MGFYTTTYIFYGCPITPYVEKVKDKINKISIDEKIEKDIMSIGLENNYITANDSVFLVVPRTKKTVSGQIDKNDVANGYVKMSEIESIDKIKKEDITPTEEENNIFSKYINALVREDKKEEMKSKIGFYMGEFGWSTYGDWSM